MTQDRMASSEIPRAASALCEAMLARDPTRVATHLSNDVVLISPLTDRFTFEGPAAVLGILADAAGVLEDLRYSAVEAVGPTVVLRARAAVRGTPIEEVVLLTLDQGGQITELTVFVRPFAGAAAFLRAVTPIVAARESGAMTAFGARRIGNVLRRTAGMADAAGASVVREVPGVVQAGGRRPGAAGS